MGTFTVFTCAIAGIDVQSESVDLGFRNIREIVFKTNILSNARGDESVPGTLSS